MKTPRASIVIALAAVLASSVAPRLSAQELSGEFSVAEVKAAFLYHFGTYVQWPEDAPSDGPLTIAVLGAPAVSFELARALPGRTIQGRSVRVRRLRTINDLGREEMLYIGPEENHRLEQIIRAVGARPTLVVTDAPSGLADGAMINFQLIDRRVRFEIATGPAERAGLTLSSRLLGAAFRVETSNLGEQCQRVRQIWFCSHPRARKVASPPQNVHSSFM